MLKKTLITAFLLVLVSAATAFAALSASTTLPAASDSFKYNISSNVSCVYDTSTTNVNYVMACKHLTGTRVFGVTNASSKIYYKENTSTDTSSGYVGTSMTGTQPLTDVSGLTAGGDDASFTGAGFTAL